MICEIVFAIRFYFLLSRGKIRFYTLPPEDNADAFISAEIVTDQVKDFDIAQFETVESNILDVLDDATNKRFVTYLPFGDEKTPVGDNQSEVGYIFDIFFVS